MHNSMCMTTIIIREYINLCDCYIREYRSIFVVQWSIVREGGICPLDPSLYNFVNARYMHVYSYIQ